jgi:hypothetical protein
MVSLVSSGTNPEGHAERAAAATLEDSLLVAARNPRDLTAGHQRLPGWNGGLSVGATTLGRVSSGISSHAWHLVVDGGVSPGELSVCEG